MLWNDAPKPAFNAIAQEKHPQIVNRKLPPLDNIVTYLLKARTAEAAVDMERLGKHVSAETNSRNNRRAVFSVQSVTRGYKKDRKNVCFCLI
jgi:CRISPR/Cas system CMR-associated protein Cmr1 (group 7 of RAMP superfamily)